MTEVTRHFTATTFIVQGDHVLLHRHPKQQLWLPPGGHIERDELPHHAAVREVEEETGLQVQLHSAAEAHTMAREMDCGVIPPPAFILVEDINPFHQHIDFVYFARMPDDSVVHETEHQIWKGHGFQWFSPAALDIEGVPQNVKAGAKRAISHFCHSEMT